MFERRRRLEDLNLSTPRSRAEGWGRALDWLLAALIVIGIIAAALVFGWASGAFAHDFWINHSGYKAPTGEHCCGDGDCGIVPALEMSATPDGWLIGSTGEVIPYGEAQMSEDGDFWRCRRADGSRRCFFAPPSGS